MYGAYFPEVNYGGGIPGTSSFQQGELQTVYGQSNDLNSLSKAAFLQFLEFTHQNMNEFKSRVGILEIQADRMRKDLINAPSQVQTVVRQALDRNLQQQAALGASLMGPVNKVNNFLMNKNVRESHAIAISGIGAQIQEDIARKSLYYQELDKNNKNIIASLGGMSQMAMQGMNLTGAMTRGGLTTALGAASALAKNNLTQRQQQIQAKQMDLQWSTALLESETNLYSDNMAYKGGVERAAMQANAMNYGAWADAQVKAYDTQVDALMSRYKTEMDGFLGTYKPNVESHDRRYIAELAQAMGLKNNENQWKIAQSDNEAAMIRASMGAAQNIFGNLAVTGDPQLAAMFSNDQGELDINKISEFLTKQIGSVVRGDTKKND